MAKVKNYSDFMVVRHRKKVKRLRGSKTHGWGSKKKHRGGGSQAGKGMAGLLKHKKSWMIKFEPNYFGKVGFKVPYVKKEKAVNLKELDRLAKLQNKKEIDVSELGYDKVLSTGYLTQPLTIKARKFVERAKEKITKAGGKVVEG